MRRALALLLAVMCAVLPAAAETRLGSLKMAVVNGEVYCITGKRERGQTTIYRLDEEGPEAVYRCPGQAWWLFEMNDRLLLGDRLYLFDPYAVAMVLDLTTGQCFTARLG